MDIWTKYKEDPSEATRNEILVKYIPVVKGVAKRMASGLPPFVGEEDLFSYGIFGLMDAIEKFDPDKGFKFETYAVTRIKGSILDELRSLDWAPRSVRAKTNAIDRVMTNSEHGMPMNEKQAATFLGISDKDYNKFKNDEYGSFIGSIDIGMAGGDKADSPGDDMSIADFIADPRADFESLIEYETIKNTIVRTINTLPERERMLIYLYYFEQMTLANIGELMQVTESRVCQIHTAICNTLKASLNF